MLVFMNCFFSSCVPACTPTCIHTRQTKNDKFTTHNAERILREPDNQYTLTPCQEWHKFDLVMCTILHKIRHYTAECLG